MFLISEYKDFTKNRQGGDGGAGGAWFLSSSLLLGRLILLSISGVSLHPGKLGVTPTAPPHLGICSILNNPITNPLERQIHNSTHECAHLSGFFYVLKGNRHLYS